MDGYEPCVNDLPCEPGLPDCSYEMTNQQQAAIFSLQQAFLLATPSSFTYPTKLYRIRLCLGDEYYVMQEELHLVPGNFRYLQEIEILFANVSLQMQVSQNMQIQTVNGRLGDLLDYRRNDLLWSVNGYEPCGELSPCHPDAPDCSPEETALQQASVALLLERMGALNPGSVSFPAHLYLVRFCDGSTRYVLEDELDEIYGSYAILQDVTLSGLGQTFTILNPNGNDYTVTVSTLLHLRIGDDEITISGFGCSEETVPQSGQCLYAIDMVNWAVAYYNDPYHVRVSYDKLITRNCGGGYEEIFRVEEDTILIGGGSEGTAFSHRFRMDAIYQAPCGPIIAEQQVVVVYPHYPVPPSFHPGLFGPISRDTLLCLVEETTQVVNCGPPIIVFDDPTFTACDPNTPLPDPDGDGCPETTQINTDLNQLASSAYGTTAANIPLPNAFRSIKMSNGTRRLVLNSELPLIDDCFETEETTPINTSDQIFHVTLPTGSANATLENVLQLRATGMSMSVEAPDPNEPQPGEQPIGSGENGVPKFTFFIYDHLGNSRILYTNNLKDCRQDSTKYLLEHVIDYYPYGKTLREYVFVRERHQTTYHERDEETGLDYRGARFYDAEVGRFLSCDPLAADYAAWGAYVYTLDNPIIFVDPDGKDVIITITAKPVGTAQMRLIGNGRVTGAPKTVEVPLYLMTVTDDATGTVTDYHVTRDALKLDEIDPVDERSIFGLEDLYSVRNTAFEPMESTGEYTGILTILKLSTSAPLVPVSRP